MDCSDAIDFVPEPQVGLDDILGTVGLQAGSRSQVSRTDSGSPHRLFAKIPLLAHPGRGATLSVPRAWAGRVSMTWGEAQWTTTMKVPACAASPGPSGDGARWWVFAGGFSLDRPACVPVEVATRTRVEVVHVPLGTRCRT